MSSETDKIRAELLYKLYRKGKIGGAHTPLKNLYHLVDNVGKREAEKACKELINKRWLFAKKSTGDIHVSLNSHKINEIKKFILDVLDIPKEFL